MDLYDVLHQLAQLLSLIVFNHYHNPFGSFQQSSYPTPLIWTLPSYYQSLQSRDASQNLFQFSFRRERFLNSTYLQQPRNAFQSLDNSSIAFRERFLDFQQSIHSLDKASKGRKILQRLHLQQQLLALYPTALLPNGSLGNLVEELAAQRLYFVDFYVILLPLYFSNSVSIL